MSTVPALKLTSIPDVRTNNQLIAPIALSALGVIGTGFTVWLACKATAKTTRKIIEKEDALGRPLTAKEKWDLCWTDYIAAASVGLATVGTEVTSGILGYKNAASAANTISILREGYERLHNATEKVLTPEQKIEVQKDIAKQTAEDAKKDPKIAKELAKTKVKDEDYENPDDIPHGYDPKTGLTLYWDQFAGFWWARRSDVKEAEYRVNEDFQTMRPIPLSDFYTIAGAKFVNKKITLRYFHRMGWSVDQYMVYGTDEFYGMFIHFEEFENTDPDGTKYIGISMVCPTKDYKELCDADYPTEPTEDGPHMTSDERIHTDHMNIGDTAVHFGQDQSAKIDPDAKVNDDAWKEHIY